MLCSQGRVAEGSIPTLLSPGCRQTVALVKLISAQMQEQRQRENQCQLKCSALWVTFVFFHTEYSRVLFISVES